MKTIKIELHSAWQKPEVFEVKDLKTAQEICEAGINQQFLVYVNGEKYRSIRSFGRSIKLD
jgi:hypothetical protein